MEFLFFLTGTFGSQATTVPISSYGACTNDGLDDTTAINLAITKVKPRDIISFEAGVYDLITPSDQYRHIYFFNKSGITLQGAIASNGAPATTLLRHVTETNNPSPPRLINITGGSNITVSNTTHRKIMYSAAHIGSNDGTGIAGDNILVRDSVFDNCGWMAKTTLTPGILTIANLHNIVTNGVLRNVTVKNCLFKNQLFSPTNPTVLGMDIDTLEISSNTFENAYRGLKINTATVSGWQVSGNTVIIGKS